MCCFCKKQGNSTGFSCLAHPQSQCMTLVKSFMIQRPLKAARVTFPLQWAGAIPTPPTSRGAAPKGRMHQTNTSTVLPYSPLHPVPGVLGELPNCLRWEYLLITEIQGMQLHQRTSSTWVLLVRGESIPRHRNHRRIPWAENRCSF